MSPGAADNGCECLQLVLNAVVPLAKDCAFSTAAAAYIFFLFREISDLTTFCLCGFAREFA